MENEIWKDIQGYEGLYQVSNIGRVKSLDRYIEYIDGRIRHYDEKIIKNCINFHGYYQVVLVLNKIKLTQKIHRLVANAFIHNPKNLPVINHRNGIKTDNPVENLEWCTLKYNLEHARSTGLLIDDGENNSRSLLTNEQAREIRALKGKMSGVEIGKIYGVNHKYVSQIIRNKRYKNV